jgi:small subunit ribosomal protein S16
MVRIRLMRVGKRKQPSYRVVVADSRSPRDGRIIEAIGHYQPRQEPSLVEIDSDRAVHWLHRGAQPSNTVRKLLQISGAWYTFTGEKPPVGAGTPAKPTEAASIKATPAASVDDEAALSEESVDTTAAEDESDAAASAPDSEDGAPEETPGDSEESTS